MTSEDRLLELLKKPYVTEMDRILKLRFGESYKYTDEVSAVLRQHTWFLDEFIKERNR